jgi:hypothetical protein
VELELTICDASEVVDLVKTRARDNVPFALVISLEGPADGVQGRAPRLAKEIGAEWTDRQVILTCNDVETGAGAPELAVVASVHLGWAMAERGSANEGIALIRDGLDSMVRGGAAPTALAALSEAQMRAGRLGEALSSLEQSPDVARKSAVELQYVLWRRGELHLRRSDQAAAEQDFREALDIARRVGSKAYELRATTSLARLLAKGDHRDESRAMLAAMYNSFSEGLATLDLLEAKSLIDELQ